MKQEKREMARKMLSRGETIADVSEVTRLSEDELRLAACSWAQGVHTLTPSSMRHVQSVPLLYQVHTAHDDLVCEVMPNIVPAKFFDVGGLHKR